jgi:hypothetical protein
MAGTKFTVIDGGRAIEVDELEGGALAKRA